MTFAAGDVVILKSGGQPMTVIGVEEDEAICIWTGDDGDLFREAIPAIALQAARADARRQHVYVEVIAAPNLPDEAMQPERLRSVAIVFAVSAAAFALLWLLSVGVKEHDR